MSRKHHNSPEQKAQVSHQKEEYSTEITHKAKPAPGHREKSKHKNEK
ncbi:hypothetical protein ACFFIX_23465 [Metabacillus herbersteinensis]|uniref:Small acid-soluble spore protein P n=1 Tax=Metabacillus herbersteinensis TaxID=283816 RepID=A0ABV6GKV9_9BACI